MRRSENPLERWADYPPPNAKPIHCPHCHRQFVIVCNDDMFELCGNYLLEQKKCKQMI